MATSEARKGNGLLLWGISGAVGVLLAIAAAVAGTTHFTGPARAAAAFMNDHGKKDGVKTTPSGLQYEVLAAGEGEGPTVDDVVMVNYEGRLPDGTVFDSSYQRGQPAVMKVSEVIPGWTEGLQLMRPGAKYRFTIPPQLGYGARGAGGVIPPNSVLQFDVELLAIAPHGQGAG